MIEIPLSQGVSLKIYYDEETDFIDLRWDKSEDEFVKWIPDMPGDSGLIYSREGKKIIGIQLSNIKVDSDE